jgi:hypothetical protein
MNRLNRADYSINKKDHFRYAAGLFSDAAFDDVRAWLTVHHLRQGTHALRRGFEWL